MAEPEKNAHSRRKELCRVRNWSEYDRALVNRGSLTIWIAEEALAEWETDGPKQRGAQFGYSDFAMEMALPGIEYHDAPGYARQLQGLSINDLLCPGLPRLRFSVHRFMHQSCRIL